MATGQPGSVGQQLRRVVIGADGGSLSDGQLLQLFLDQQDQTAFSVLVRRHGPMVLGVCRRVLQQAQDAEDAFQATFLVLVRKAASIVPRDMVGNWLYGVAYRTALKLKGANATRRTKEREAPVMSASEPTGDAMWQDLQPLLDQELHRLPDKYRVPVVLCDLEGKSRKDAARLLGWPEGTLSWRLASARSMLAKRLARHGLVLSAGSLALVLAQQAVACVPPPLLVSTVQAAALPAAGQAVAAGLISTQVAALTEGVLRTMMWIKLKITMAVLVGLTVVGTSVGVVSYRSLAVPAHQVVAADGERQPANAQRDPNKPAQREAGGQGREERRAADLQGNITAIADNGKTLTVASSAGRGEEPKTTTIKLTDQSKVNFDAPLKDSGATLKVGDAISVMLQAGSKDTAASIAARRAANLTGKIVAVAADGKMVSIETPAQERGGAPGKVDIKLTDKTRTETARPSADQKPTVGYIAAIWLQDGTTDTAFALHVSRPRADVQGEIKSIAADGKTITIEGRGRGGDAGPTTTIKITDQTKLEFTGVEKADDKKLKVGIIVTVWLQEGSQDTAASLETSLARRAADIAARIAAVAADGKSFTVEVGKRGEEPTKMEIKLNDKTIVEFMGVDKEEDKKIRAGDTASIWVQEGTRDAATVVRITRPAPRGER
jgi:RNA polymerase sigma factor (sigma-70 family)